MPHHASLVPGRRSRRCGEVHGFGPGTDDRDAEDQRCGLVRECRNLAPGTDARGDADECALVVICGIPFRGVDVVAGPHAHQATRLHGPLHPAVARR